MSLKALSHDEDVRCEATAHRMPQSQQRLTTMFPDISNVHIGINVLLRRAKNLDLENP